MKNTKKAPFLGAEQKAAGQYISPSDNEAWYLSLARSDPLIRSLKLTD